MNPITFPGLGLTFHIQRVAFQIFGKDIYWYGIIIAAGFLLAAAFCSWRARDFGIKKDDFLDMLLWGLPIGIICARIYYVIFYLSLYRDAQGNFQWGEAIAIWDGGLAIYGGVIGGILTCLVVCKCKKLPFLAMADLSVMGLFIGQIMGRWGNFVNQEAYGGACDLPWRMGLIVDGQIVTVHPTFLYESHRTVPAGVCGTAGASVRRGTVPVLPGLVRPGAVLDRGAADGQPVPVRHGYPSVPAGGAGVSVGGGGAAGADAGVRKAGPPGDVGPSRNRKQSSQIEEKSHGNHH